MNGCRCDRRIHALASNNSAYAPCQRNQLRVRQSARGHRRSGTVSNDLRASVAGHRGRSQHGRTASAWTRRGWRELSRARRRVTWQMKIEKMPLGDEVIEWSLDERLWMSVGWASERTGFVRVEHMKFGDHYFNIFFTFFLCACCQF